MATPELGPIVELLRGIFKEDATVQEQRGIMEAAAQAFLPAPGTAIAPVTVGGVPGEWLTTAASRDDRVVLYLHGGGYTMGSPRSHRGLAERVATASAARVLLLD